MASDRLSSVTDAARIGFCEQAALPDEQMDVARAALWVAAEAQPDVDVSVYLAQLDALALAVRPQIEAAPSTRAAVEALCHSLFQEHGFRGDEEDYYDPRNSFLNDVIDRRRGIPITLSILFVEVARRVGLEAHGVGFPGHFLAKVVPEGGAPEIVIDAFRGGQILDREDCEALLRGVLGEDAEFDPALLRAARPKEILARMLSNLKQIHVQRRELEAALACCDRLLLLDPESPFELRDRGLLYRELECHAAALRDLERFLELAPGHDSATSVRQVLEPLRALAAQLH